MINTSLHNLLIEEAIKEKGIQNSIAKQQAKTILLKERVKYISIIILTIIIILFLFIMLVKLFPNDIKNLLDINCPKSISQQNEIKKNTIVNPQELDNNSVNDYLITEEKKANNFSDEYQKTIPKNGIEYIKKNNYVYKRVWKNGYLIDELKLEKTIEESNKYEKIPKYSNPVKNLNGE